MTITENQYGHATPEDSDTLSCTDISSVKPGENLMSETSTMTMTDRVGAGRTLGKVIARGGRRIEAYVGQVASGLGFGPQAAAQGLLARLIDADMNFFSTTFHDSAIELEARIGCEKLLQFMK